MQAYGDEEEEEDSGDEWGQLETIQEFDGFGGLEHTPYLRNNIVIPGARGQPTAPNQLYEMGGSPNIVSSTPVSILVSSLVGELCSLLEQDKDKSKVLYQNICENLQNMQLIDDTWDKSEFDIARTSYKNSLIQLLSLAHRDPAHPNSRIIPLSKSESFNWSRYHLDFEELDFIAGGGFGKVYRARQKLDGVVYAVKKIIIKATTICEMCHHLSEVKTFASLNHVNIVSYKNAWLEPLMDTNSHDLQLTDEEDDEEQEDGDELSSMLTEEVSRQQRLKKKKNRETLKSVEESSQSIVFQRSSADGAGKNDLWSLSHVSSMEISRESGSDGISSRAIVQYDQMKHLQPYLKLHWAILYIQMLECQCTLRKWLDDRNTSEDFDQFYMNFLSNGKVVDEDAGACGGGGDVECGQSCKTEFTHVDVIEEIFGQLINGLRYIHDKNIVHHDIKPSNIFISVDDHGTKSNLLVQLGDFGLACPLEKQHSKQVVGTRLYAAPEQLQGKCDKKSDIFSLGVILIELLVPCVTEMERNKTIENAKRKIFPECVPEAYRGLINQLLTRNLADRPTADELNKVFASMRSFRDPIVEDLQRKLATQNEMIAGLRQTAEKFEENLKSTVQSQKDELAKKEEQIALLEKQLADKSAQQFKSQMYIHSKHKHIRRLKKLTQQISTTSSSSETG